MCSFGFLPYEHIILFRFSLLVAREATFPSVGRLSGFCCGDAERRVVAGAELRVVVGAELRVVVGAELRVVVGAELRVVVGADPYRKCPIILTSVRKPLRLAEPQRDRCP